MRASAPASLLASDLAQRGQMLIAHRVATHDTFHSSTRQVFICPYSTSSLYISRPATATPTHTAARSPTVPTGAAQRCRCPIRMQHASATRAARTARAIRAGSHCAQEGAGSVTDSQQQRYTIAFAPRPEDGSSLTTSIRHTASAHTASLHRSHPALSLNQDGGRYQE